ncbi:MAG: ankyrin repeat domain-containing protein [Gallionella sp.]|nr:ankyrin repeat domain-containing protein [Gallionella sp.]
MDEKLLSMLDGNEKLYPKNLEQHFPRVFNRIIELWYSPDIDAYFTDLMMDTRDGARQGFPPDAASEIFSLSMAHTALRDKAKTKQAASNPWDDVESSKRAAIEQQGYKFSPRGFIQSAEKGDRKAILLFLGSGVNIDTRDDRGWTPLMVSTFNGREEIATLLIQSGANVHAKDSAGYGPLHWAAFNGYSSVVKLLIEKRADVNACSNHGLTPLLQAATRGHLEAAERLIVGGANVNLASDEGWTPLHKAAANGHIEMVKLLLANKADCNLKLQSGITPQTLATKNKHSEIVAMLAARS